MRSQAVENPKSKQDWSGGFYSTELNNRQTVKKIQTSNVRPV